MESTSALPDRPTITVSEAAELLGISKDSAYAAARSGDLPVLRLGRRYLVSVPRLRALLGDGPNAA
jgi:excisionase family DNA binding protein